jgi:hypothetical protein
LNGDKIKKAYCDICGIECEHIGDRKYENILFTWEKENETLVGVDLVDLCWTCRRKIGLFIEKMKDDAHEQL